jgi:phospholipase/lecithinase/hemolysin
MPSPPACREYFAEALFVVGEFGWNDYAFMLMSGKSVDEARSRVPRVVRTIRAAAEKLIGEGARTVVVPGVTPLGCAPGNLVLYATQEAADYEPDTGCLKALNALSREHNRQLRQALARLRRGRSPAEGVRVVYADFYSPVADFAAAPGRYGFDGTDGALRACCGGGGGRYNVNLSMACGTPGVSACPDPSRYVNWDGIHLTEAANHRIADGWLRGPYAQPPILDLNTYVLCVRK